MSQSYRRRMQNSPAADANESRSAQKDLPVENALSIEALKEMVQQTTQGLSQSGGGLGFLFSSGSHSGWMGEGTRLAQGTSNKAPIIDQHRMDHERSGAFCGIATLLTTLQANGVDPGVDIKSRADLEKFAQGIYINGSGSSGEAMAQRLKDHGEDDAKMIRNGSIRQIVATLDKGHVVPVGFISMGGTVSEVPQESQRYGAAISAGSRHEHQFGSSGHWATVVSYEGDSKSPTHFLVNDSDTGAELRLTRAELERHAGGNNQFWMIPY